MSTNGILDFQNTNKIIFRGSDSNVVIDTSNVSLGIGIQGTETPGSNLHVVGNAFISSDLTVSGDVTVSSNLTVSGNVSDLNVVSNVNMLHTSNTAALKVNSNVVTEFPRSKKLIKYPRVAMTQNALNNGYAAEASTEHDGTSSGQAYRVFDGLFLERGYHSTNSTYSSGIYQSNKNITDANNKIHTGEWIKLQMPTTEKMQLRGFTFHPRNETYAPYRIPLKGVFLGSTDGNNWYPIHYFDNFGITNGAIISSTKYFEPTNHVYYNHIAFVAYKVQNHSNGSNLNFAELDLFGIPEYDPDAHGTDVTIKSVANVPNTDWLEVYYDAKNYTSGVVQDLSTNSFNGTLTNGASYNNSDGIDKFVFDAGTNQYMTTTTNISGSAFIHTTSMWVKFVEVSTDSNDQHFLFNLGAWGSNSIGMYYSANQGIRVATGFDYRTQYHPVAGRWFHVSYTYAGGAHGTAAMNTTVKFYINGQQWNIPAYYGGTTTVTLPSSSVLQINGSAGNNNTLMDMEVANFRIFNRALSSDEIYQLYAYQKEDFGHGDLSMTLKAGRLGIGTSEPRADLDVRGDVCMKLQGYFELNQGTRPAASTTSHGMRWTNTDNTNHWHLFNSDNEHFRFVYNGVAKGYVDPNDANAQMNFTGQHRTFIKDIPFTRVIELEGLIVSADNNKYIKMSGGIEVGSNAITTNESLPVVSLSNVVTDKKCFGVISASEDPEQRSDAYGSFITPFDKEKGDTRVYINSVGEGAIWVSNIDGNLESGDYITTSNIVGYGQKQEGAGLMNYTVAKITMDCDFEPATQPIQIIKKDETGENVLDEHDQIQWEDHPTETEKAYKIKYLDASGVETDEANAVHTAAFVGCTYHCG